MKFITLILSLTLFLVSLWMKENVNVDGRYKSKTLVYLNEDLVAEEGIDITLDRKKFESILSVSGKGIDGVAIFSIYGIVEKKSGFDYKISAQSEELQRVSITNQAMLERYRELHLNSKLADSSWIKFLYINDNIVLIQQSESSREYLLFVRNSR